MRMCAQSDSLKYTSVRTLIVFVFALVSVNGYGRCDDVVWLSFHRVCLPNTRTHTPFDIHAAGLCGARNMHVCTYALAIQFKWCLCVYQIKLEVHHDRFVVHSVACLQTWFYKMAFKIANICWLSFLFNCVSSFTSFIWFYINQGPVPRKYLSLCINCALAVTVVLNRVIYFGLSKVEALRQLLATEYIQPPFCLGENIL